MPARSATGWMIGAQWSAWLSPQSTALVFASDQSAPNPQYSWRKSIELHVLRTLPFPHFLQAAHVLDVRRQSRRKSVQRGDTQPGNRGGRCGGKAEAHGHERLGGAPARGLFDKAPG